MRYSKHTWRNSRIHLLEVNLDEYEVRPVPGAEAFPFLRVYPIMDAVEQGAIAAVGGGYNTTLFHKFPDRVPDEPLHAMVINREIWTTGVGAGGAGLILGDDAEGHAFATTLERNKVNVTVWKPNGFPINVESVNHGHTGKVVAFNPRGGNNEKPGIRVIFNASGRFEEPISDKHYVLLVPIEDWDANGDDFLMRREFNVVAISNEEPPPFFANDIPQPEGVILESKWPQQLQLGDNVTWSQRLGAPGAHTIVSGWPQVIRDGKNVVPLLDLHGEASHGPDNWFIRKNPRMIIGVSQDRRTAFLCTIEGRVPNTYAPDQEWSVGLRLKEAATWLLGQGVWEADNFDGGGSAWMMKRSTTTGSPILRAPGCYNTRQTLGGLRPDHYVIGVWKR